MTISLTQIFISILFGSFAYVFFAGVKERLQDTHSAQQLIVAFIGIFRSYARHSVLNSLRAIELLDSREYRKSYNIRKQLYHIDPFETMIGRMLELLSANVAYKFYHYYYLVRNFNSDIEKYASKDNLTDREMILILERNCRLAILENYAAEYFENMDRRERNIFIKKVI